MRFQWILVLAACGRSTTPAPSPPPPTTPTPELAVTVEDAAAAEDIPEPNRPLTRGEVALLEPIFHDSIDYAHVRVINNTFPFQPKNVYMTPRGHVYAPGELWSDDFSSTRERAVFVHEMTHVWQFANGMDLVGQGLVEYTKYKGDYEKAYPYELATNRDLIEYGMEQQASIVEDFFLITYASDTPRRMTNAGLSAEQRDALYAAVLAKFAKNPRYARGLDAKLVAAQHGAESDKTKPGPAACNESESEHGTTHMCSWRFEQPQ